MDINCFSKYLAAMSNSISDPVTKLVCLFVCFCSFFDFTRLLTVVSKVSRLYVQNITLCLDINPVFVSPYFATLSPSQPSEFR